MLAAMLMVVCAAPVAAADDAEMTPEFIEEGVQKAVDVMNQMAVQIGELESMEQIQEIDKIVNSIEFRNIRKKYGKIVLTDEHRERLVQANLAMLQALNDYFIRCGMPFEVREAMAQELNEEKIRKDVMKSKTLRDAMS